MERLTSKKEADAQRKAYERRLKQGYPRNIPEERFLKLAAYEDAEEEGRWVALPPKTQDVDFMRIFELITADGEGRAIILPCKVGDMVYYRKGQYIYGNDVKRIVLDGIDNQVIVDANHCYTFSDFGVKVFLTSEVAEAALKGEVKDG